MPSINMRKHIDPQDLQDIKEKLGELKVYDEKIIELLERGKIRLDAHISKILDRVDLGQDSYDAILKLLLDYGKKKGLRK